jgi:hypothetical protein
LLQDDTQAETLLEPRTKRSYAKTDYVAEGRRERARARERDGVG